MAKIGENFPDVPRRRRAPRSKGLDAAVRTRTSVFPECAHNLRTAGPKCWHYYVIWRSCISYMIIQSFLNLFLQDLFSCIARTSFCFFACVCSCTVFLNDSEIQMTHEGSLNLFRRVWKSFNEIADFMHARTCMNSFWLNFYRTFACHPTRDRIPFNS